MKGDVDDRIVKSIFSWGKLWKKVLRGRDKLQFQSYNRLGGLQKNICPNTSNPSTGVLLNAIPLIADWGNWDKTFPKSRNLEWYGRESHMFCGLSQWQTTEAGVRTGLRVHICFFYHTYLYVYFIYNSISIYKMVVFIIIPWSLVAPSRTLQQWEGNASIKIAPYCHVSHLLPTPSCTVACFQTNVKQFPVLVSVKREYPIHKNERNVRKSLFNGKRHS